MNELIQIGEKTYYISGPFHVGIYDLGTESYTGRKEVCLIDSGVDKTVAKVIDKRLIENEFTVKMIINTHYHADHCGGNAYFKKNMIVKYTQQSLMRHLYLTSIYVLRLSGELFLLRKC